MSKDRSADPVPVKLVTSSQRASARRSSARAAVVDTDLNAALSEDLLSGLRIPHGDHRPDADGQPDGKKRDRQGELTSGWVQAT